MCLGQAKSKTKNDITVLGGLALIIIMGDFYQFAPVIERSLWTYPITNDKIHVKGDGMESIHVSHNFNRAKNNITINLARRCSHKREEVFSITIMILN